MNESKEPLLIISGPTAGGKTELSIRLARELDGEIMPLDFAKNAEGYGLKSYSIRTEEELKAALADALKQDRPVLYDIKVVPGSMTPGYDNWWRVGVAEVSENPRVAAAYESLTEHVKDTRKF